MRLSVASSLSCITALVAAYPHVSERGLLAFDDNPTGPVVGKIYDNLKYYAQYAASSYCNSEDVTGAPVTCSGGCPAVMANAATVIGNMGNTTKLDIEGFVAVDKVRKEIVLVYRGSSSLLNWLADFEFIKVPCDYTDGCNVHSGFKSSWDQVSSYTFSYVKKAFALYPDYTLVVTGHSLGGAVGTLAAIELRNAGHPCDLYTYGSPRVGNLAFVKYVVGQPGHEYRVTHFDDPVPRLPPIIFNYFHTSPELWLASGPATDASYSVGQIKVCLGFANVTCNGGTFGLDGKAHDYYFGYMSCDATAQATASIHGRGAVGDGRPLWQRDGLSPEELEQRLDNYTMQDIAYSQQLVADGTV